MKRSCLVALMLLFICALMQSCSSGSSSSDSAGLSCTDIAGSYDGRLIFPGLKPAPAMDVKVNSDCSFVAKNSTFGVNTGTLTSKEGNNYYGEGNSPNGCHGPMTVKVVDLGGGRVNIHPTCTPVEGKNTLVAIEVVE